jgi:hypothetical protein
MPSLESERQSAGVHRTITRWEGNQLSRLGRLACSSFCFRDGVLDDGSGELGELEYDDEDPASGWTAARWRCSGIVMDVGVFSIDDDC